MKKNIRQFIVIFLILVMASCLALSLYRWDNKYTKPGAQPIAGIVFIEETSLQDTPLHFLWNGWLFCPDKLLTPRDMNELDSSQLVSLIIGEHNNFALMNQEQSPHGSGTYLLTLMLPETPDTYSIELPEIFSAYRFYVNDELLLEVGNPSAENYQPLIQNHVVTFTASGATRLMLAVRNESHIYSGMVYPPAFGTPQAVDHLQNLRMFLCAITITCTLLFAALSLWVSLKSYRQQPNTEYFFLLCLCITISISYGVIHSFVPMEVWPWYSLELVSGYLATFLIVIVHNRLCDISPLVQKISNGLVGFFSLAILFYGALGMYATRGSTEFFIFLIPIFKVATALYLLATAFLSLRRRKQQISILFYADVFYATLLIWDRFLPAYEPILGGWFPEWGCLGMVIALGIILWQDVTTGYRLSLTFREEQRQMERQINIQREHYYEISRQVEESRRMRHDFRQHLRTIAGMADNRTALVEYINKIDSVNEAARPESYFHNPAVDALLYHYIHSAREKDYSITVRIEAPKEILLPDEVSFCTILGNLLENALEACGRQPTGERFIHLYVRCQHDDLHLLLENSFDGIIHPSRNGYSSRKHDGEGIGVVSARKLAARLGGSVEFLAEQNIFQTMLVLPMKHI